MQIRHCRYFLLLDLTMSTSMIFSREWSDSLRVKRREPLGETAIVRMLSGKRG